MRHIRTLYIFLVFILLPSTPFLHAATEQRTALVIGNSNYTSGPLKNPANDAVDMSNTLEKLGFNVILKTNATKREMGKAVEDFDVGLFYYAGHGVQVNGVNYLIPVGVKINEETDVEYEAIDAGRILATMRNAKSRINIVILDACRDNPYARSFRSATRGLAIIANAPMGTIISYSTSPGDVALDGKGRNSPYTSSLLKYIKEPGLTIEQVFKHVRQQIDTETGGKQVPWELSSMKGEFYFNPEEPSATRLSMETRDKEKDMAMAKPPVRVSGETKTLRNSFGMVFVLIKAGSFIMGSPIDEKDRRIDETQHQVTISKDFYMQTTKVTQGQWRAIMGKNSTELRYDNGWLHQYSDDGPTKDVTWNQVKEFIRKLNQREKSTKYRLPTEAEWEYAARAGTATRFYWGDQEDCSKANCNVKGWEVYPETVGSHPPNPWGLYDMIGNVVEWVKDKSDLNGRMVLTDTYRDGVIDPLETKGIMRVIRGCAWRDSPSECRVASRSCRDPNHKNDVGFRLVRMP